MRRRPYDDGVVEPPARLRVLPDDWQAEGVYAQWLEDRRLWLDLHGWPGGWDALDLLRDAYRQHRARMGWDAPAPDPDHNPERPAR